MSASSPHPNCIQVILVHNRDFGRTARAGLDGVLKQLPVIPHHIQLLFHRHVAKCLLDLVIASEKDNSLLGSEESKLVLSSLIKRRKIKSCNSNAEVWGKL